jgi:hypothetical protein
MNTGQGERQGGSNMTKPHQEDEAEPFFITENVATELTAVGYEFELPDHTRTTSLPKVPAGLTDAELATWPSELSKGEIERRSCCAKAISGVLHGKNQKN